jgi:membrane protease subunit HflC
MNKTFAILLGVVIVAVLVLFNTTFTVNFHEIAVKTRFGKPTGIVGEGLHLKLPFFIDRVSKLDTRLQLVDSPLETVMTRDGQQVVVQAFLLWKVDEQDADAVMRFYTSYGSVEAAGRELETRLQGAVRAIGGYEFRELIGTDSRLGLVEEAILQDLRENAVAGIDPVSVGISRVVLPPKTTVAVLSRMAEVQNTLARLEEARGNSEAEALRSQAAAQADAIRSFAEQWAARIEAVGNEEATRYYQQMKEETQLAIFLAWVDTLKAGLRGSTTFVTDTARAPFHLLEMDAPVGADGIPQPAAASLPQESSNRRGGDR